MSKQLGLAVVAAAPSIALQGSLEWRDPGREPATLTNWEMET
jgi:hypothetical protein